MTRQASFALILTAALLASCNVQSTLRPAGPAAEELSDLNWFLIILFLTITVVMLGLIALVLTRPRGSLDEHEPVGIGGGHSWILIGGFGIPAAILSVVFGVGLAGMSKFPLHDGSHMPPEIRVVGHQWWWELHYVQGGVDQQFVTANEIHIPVGRPVDIDLTSRDVIHSFWVPSLHGKVDLLPKQPNRIRIQASRAGTFRGQCAEYCGEQHAHMNLMVVADPPDQYQRWLAGQLQPALSPGNEEQARGQVLFMNRPCLLCHTIRGTGAGGRAGPDLTHIGSRRKIAANMLDNDIANLSAWVTHAQSLKPGAEMPNVTQFTGPELHEIVAYLQSLK